ncbi:hypothetical protein KSP35_12005 [Aquihabitans sp. G128]|uniref:fibrinogen-like YCDxxxxGGGW domain-containing protein n=1 Tax=Aquihabitans sp. G128 TaxID=2849779 RepID=UPI001C2386DF|nr:fibrinogen-like YCDxxxxGGGW domain-containing protein [Aquihabitans sp. G128]QXC59138.1 hypothetical protein KSP35_12005 [Aquihabitans sp. G128]
MRTTQLNRRWTIAATAFLALVAVVPATAALRSGTAAAAPAAAGDGTTSTTAGASCWGIKQQHPTSASGTYWVLTASMDRPVQVACDMATDGGGWVLVGRGRNGWTFSPNGQGSPATVRTTTDGTGAFAPASLDTTLIDGLLDHGAPSALADGIRLERSTNAAGTTKQDYRLYSKAREWTWNLAAGQLLNKVTVNGTTYNGSNTRDTAASVQGQATNGLAGVQDTRRLFTFAWANHANQQGFGFGSQVGGGSNAATNHLWTSANEGSPLAFTKVWLRPRIANDAAGFTPIPAAGYPAQAKVPSLKNRSELARWGVSGYNHTNEATVTPWQDNVMVIKVYGDRVYVGGRFTGVQNGPGATPIAQGSLAAFDLDGNWISTFRPNVAGRVWDMTLTDDGKLIIGGDFTSVDGVADTSALAALDPATGKVLTTWKASATRSGGGAIVRGLDSKGDWIYASGRFTTVKGGTAAPTTTTNAINLRTTNGTPGSWRPQVFASAVRLRVSAAGDRVYMAGFFNAVNGDTNHGFYGITNPTNGAVIPGIGPYQPSEGSRANNWYQQAVAEYGNKILVGGAEHTLQMYDHNRTTLIDSHITKQGGDFQAIEVFDGYAYASCHCMNWTYSGTNSWSNPRGYRAVDPIRMVGRWNAETFDYDTTWWPNGTKGTNDEGIWSISQDKRKCLWVGGDLVRGSYSGNAATDYLGGFARFCPTDAVVPTTPTNLRATTASGAVNLSWTGSTDASGTVSYDVYRDDRVIASVFGTTFSDATVAAGSSHRYTVRAADTRGNRSASPAPVAVNGPAPTVGTPVAFGSTWRYRADGADLGTAWRSTTYDDSAFATGKAVLGWGGTQATTIDGAGRPTTSYFRTSFDVADPAAVKVLELQALFTQGAVLYVNGVEAGRTNLPTGAISAATPASAYVGGAEDLRTKTYEVPGSLLKAGRNTIAVEVHGWRAASGKVFLDLQATTRGATADNTAPSAPALTAAAGSGTVDLTWTPSSDETALGGYLVSRDGAPVAVVGPQDARYVDATSTAQAHTYVVTAFDTSGNTAASAPRQTAPPVSRTLLAFGSSWTWWYQATAPAGAWQAPGYATTGWQVGPGELGFGDTPKGTVITSAPSPRPLTSYYRTTVTVADPSIYRTVLVDLVRNAGAVVYVNGVEVARSNLPTGAIGPGTYALTAPAAAQRHVPVRLEVPASAFHAGANTIAVELHLNYKAQPTAGFDLQLTGQP